MAEPTPEVPLVARVGRRLRREIGLDSFADLGAAVAAIHRGEGGEAVVEFAEPVDEATAQAVADRMGSRTEADADLLAQARVAWHANAAWVADTLPQIETGAQQILDHASSTPQDKQLAKGVRALSDQLAALTRQVNVLIRLEAEQMGSD